ncbi:MAG: ribosome-associated translation inhibitor RaiA [Deltaproteobacteria bacterium]|nr:ribosome-associated translation inhibitor RaiA [Deltaproteobacteria bacterium]
MPVTVTFRHLEPSQPIKDYIEDKIARLKKYADTSLDAHVVLSVEKFRHIADVTISFNGQKINGEESTGDMYSSIDLVLDKLTKQIKRVRGKIKNKKGNDRIQTVIMNVIDAQNKEQAQADSHIVKSTQFLAKPMDIEEAIEQLEANKNDFFIYADDDTDQINVVYKRRDGNYGLIQPMFDYNKS